MTKMQSLYDIFNEKIYIFSVLHKYFSANDSMILYFVVYPCKQFEKAKLVYKIWIFVSCNIYLRKYENNDGPPGSFVAR